MKVLGIIFLIFGFLNFVVAIVAAANEVPDAASSKLGSAVMLVGLGALLVHFANKKKEEQEKKDVWNQH